MTGFGAGRPPDQARMEGMPVDPDLAPTDPVRPLVGVAGGPQRKRRHMHVRLDVLVAIAAGGALGTAARAELGVLFVERSGRFPWTTLCINVSGSFVLGVALVLLLERLGPSRFPRPFFATGFLGAFTTFSTFVVGAALLVKDGHAAIAAAYVVASLVGGLVAAVFGVTAGRRAARPVQYRRERP